MTRRAKSRELMEEIHQQVHKANLLARAIVHWFGFTGEGEFPPGQSPPPPNPDDEKLTPEDFENFLRKLAEENGGNFTRIE